MVKFYIVTPSYRALPWLRAAVRSVADQTTEGIEIHHHIQDGGSDDGTIRWLQEWQCSSAKRGYRLTYDSAADGGMYDALNRAWDAMPADTDITAHLNADEQYMPGALQAVAKRFNAHPAADIVECSYFVTDSRQQYYCHRRCILPTRWISVRVCQLCTCATFYRAATIRPRSTRFNTDFRIYADVLFFRRLMERGVNVVTAADLFSSAFTMTGNNLAWQKAAKDECRRLNAMTPPLYMRAAFFGGKYTALKRLLSDFLLETPKKLSLYRGDQSERTEECILHPSCRWKRCTNQNIV